MMRKLVAGLTLGTLTACGVFGASDDKAADPTPMPGTPADNAMPPTVGGAPISGVYVSASRGANDGSGSADRPLKTLAAGFAMAKAQGLRVIACAESYNESIELIDGVSAYGAWDCSQTPWVVSTIRAIVRSPTSPAVHATGISMPTRIDGFNMRGPDLDGAPATDAVAASIGLEVHASTGLVVSNSVVHGGTGAPGTDGAIGPNNSVESAVEGSPAHDQSYRTCVVPAGANPLTYCQLQTVPGGLGAGPTMCAIGPAGGPGGQGGSGEWYSDPSTPALGTWNGTGLPYVATAVTAAGGSATPGASPGNPGGPGTEGTDGKNGAWSITTKGFVRGNGEQGGPAGPGQGGGGGAGVESYYNANGLFVNNPPGSTYFATATGAGGGSGGCAGQPGTPGTGGGASIGLLLFDSVVDIETTHIESSAGGKAGKGNLGTQGTFGGKGGAAVGVVSGITFKPVTGRGGDGGLGGNGGASGHGSPGPSIAIAYSKTKPTLGSTVTLAAGTGGQGQPELTRMALGAAGTKRLPAVVGASLPIYEIP